VLDEHLEGVDKMQRLKNWDEFQDVLEDARRQKADLQLQTTQTRMNKSYSPPNPYASYPADSIESIAVIVGLKNGGINYNPDLNSANSAQV
jgi:hypothetical protein